MAQDHEVFEEIQETLEAFQAHSISLGTMIEKVPNLVKQISGDTAWKDEFVGYWWTLEQVHEEAIEAGEGQRLPAERRNAVDDAVLRMQRLIDGALTSA